MPTRTREDRILATAKMIAAVDEVGGEAIAGLLQDVARRFDSGRRTLLEDFEVEESVIQELDLIEYAIIELALLLNVRIVWDGWKEPE